MPKEEIWHFGVVDFDGKPDPRAWALNASLPFDKRLAAQDMRGSLAWAEALRSAGVLTDDEKQQICSGLEAIRVEFSHETFDFNVTDEDIHTAVERRLFELIGEPAGKLHTGRSRNDQVATDFRLWMMDAIPELDSAIISLQSVLVERAKSDLEVMMPGYTHLQRAQPILLSHWWLSYFWPLGRDRQRLSQLRQRTAVLPLGSGALAGAPFAIDRELLARLLGFQSISPNSLDAVSDRDFAAEFLFCAALAGIHLSKLAELTVLFTTAEFGFFELADAFSSGSSLMPQKKNPDVFELGRGKSGALIGLLTGLLATLKGLPSTYDKDLQEDKLPVFTAFDTLMALLTVFAAAVQSITIHAERMRLALDASLLATDLADYLVERGVVFREAHAIVGQAVQLATRQNVSLDMLPLEAYRSISPLFNTQLFQVFDPAHSIARRAVFGGTALPAVHQQIELAQAEIKNPEM